MCSGCGARSEALLTSFFLHSSHSLIYTIWIRRGGWGGGGGLDSTCHFYLQRFFFSPLSRCVPVSFCLSMAPYLSFHLSPLLPLLFVSLSAVLSSQHSLHLSGRVIEPCVPSLSAKRLADCLHFHAEGCEASVAVVRDIDWDLSKALPVGMLPAFLVGGHLESLWLLKMATYMPHHVCSHLSCPPGVMFVSIVTTGSPSFSSSSSISRTVSLVLVLLSCICLCLFLSTSHSSSISFP